MKRSGSVKFPQSVQLFKFCQKVMSEQRGAKIRDQEVGAILNYNPSDCSHWKRGEKNVRSVFALAKLADTLGVETGLIHDLTSGSVNVEEAFFEYQEARSLRTLVESISTSIEPCEAKAIRERTLAFVDTIQQECDFTTPPLYLPEVLRAFSFISTQPIDMLDKLSRILRVKAGRYCIQFQKGDLKPQTRMSMVKDLSRIVFEAERERFPELGVLDRNLVQFEEAIFTANLLIPRTMLLSELAKLDVRRNVISELATVFWAPKSLIGFQMKDILKNTKDSLAPSSELVNNEQLVTTV